MDQAMQYLLGYSKGIVQLSRLHFFNDPNFNDSNIKKEHWIRNQYVKDRYSQFSIQLEINKLNYVQHFNILYQTVLSFEKIEDFQKNAELIKNYISLLIKSGFKKSSGSSEILSNTYSSSDLKVFFSKLFKVLKFYNKSNFNVISFLHWVSVETKFLSLDLIDAYELNVFLNSKKFQFSHIRHKLVSTYKIDVFVDIYLMFLKIGLFKIRKIQSRSLLTLIADLIKYQRPMFWYVLERTLIDNNFFSKQNDKRNIIKSKSYKKIIDSYIDLFVGDYQYSITGAKQELGYVSLFIMYSFYYKNDKSLNFRKNSNYINYDEISMLKKIIFDDLDLSIDEKIKPGVINNIEIQIMSANFIPYELRLDLLHYLSLHTN